MLPTSIVPPRRQMSGAEGLVETWVFRTYVEGSSRNDLNTKVADILNELRKHDQALVIQRNSQTIVTSTNNGVYNIRCEALKVAGENDLEAGQELEITISYTVPMHQTDNDVWGKSYKGRKAVGVSIGFSAARRRLIHITCIYTATSTGTPKTAKENFDTEHAAWTAAILAKTAGSGNVDDRLDPIAGVYDLLSEDVSGMNRIDAEISVTSTFQEILEDETDSENEPALIDVHWAMSRRHGGRLGKSTLKYGPKSKDAPITISVTYKATVSAAVLSGGTGGDTMWGIAEIFEMKVRDIMVTRARDRLYIKTADYDVIRGPLTFSPTLSDRQFSASMDLTFVRKRGRTITGPGANKGLWIDYDETISLDINYQNRYRKVLDGQNDTYDSYSPGRLVRVTDTQTATTFKAEAPEPPLREGDWKLDQRTKQSQVFYVDIEDEYKQGDDKFTAEFQEEVWITVYTTSYTHAVTPRVGGGRTQGRSGLDVPLDSGNMLALGAAGGGAGDVVPVFNL